MPKNHNPEELDTPQPGTEYICSEQQANTYKQWAAMQAHWDNIQKQALELTDRVVQDFVKHFQNELKVAKSSTLDTPDLCSPVGLAKPFNCQVPLTNLRF